VRNLIIFLAAAGISALSLSGCGSDDGPGAPQDGEDAGTVPDANRPDGGGMRPDAVSTDANSGPALTLKADILPIMARGCALSASCHRSGTTYPPNLGPGYVDGGLVATDEVVATIMTSLGMSSTQVPGLLRVKKGDPDQSYLMRKLEGTQARGDLACMVTAGSAKPCGERMPGGGSPPLEADELKLIRDWITQGAN
jgi:hypothetical protein